MRKLLLLLSLFVVQNGFTWAQDTLLYPSLLPGSAAPKLKGQNEFGKTMRLDRVKSRLTLLYFYEVHCHLCAGITPELKKLYENYHQLGLEVVAIATAGSKQDWKDYTRENELAWMNVYPGIHEIDELRNNYKLIVSPTIYLLDRHKKLLTPRLWSIEQVEEELNKYIR